MLNSLLTEHILSGETSPNQQGSQSQSLQASVPLSDAQKRLIYDEHAHQIARGNSPTVKQLAEWAKNQFALQNPPDCVSISRILNNSQQVPNPLHQTFSGQQAEISTPQLQRHKNTSLTAEQKNMIFEEHKRLLQKGKKPNMSYLRQWAQHKFQLAKQPTAGTVAHILGKSNQPAISQSPSTQIQPPESEEQGDVKVIRMRRMGLKYVTLSHAQKKEIQQETKRRIAAGSAPTYEEMALWAKDNFNLEKFPSTQTITRLLQQTAGIPKLRGGITKRRQSRPVVVDPPLPPPAQTSALFVQPSVQFPPVDPANLAVVPTNQQLFSHQLPLSMTGPLTTHALDTSTGRPAAGLELELYRKQDDGTEQFLCHAQCNVNGRVADLIARDQWREGVYRLRFMTERYFKLANIDCFYPYCDVTFSVRDTSSHYHVPLLISPFGFTTYRGS